MVLALIFSVILFALWSHLFRLQVVEPQKYADIQSGTYVNTVITEGVRGEIFDRFGRPLASNRYVWSLYYDASTESKNLNDICHHMAVLLQNHQLQADLDFALEYSEGTGVVYRPRYENSATLRILFLAEIFSKSSINLTSAEKRTTAEEAYLFMRDELFKIPADQYTVQEILEIMRFRYAFYIQRFKTEEPILILQDLPEELRVNIYERQMDYPGFFCRSEETRYYPGGEAFSHILGYLGSIPEDAYESQYKARGYQIDDVIGRDGLEAVYESSLRGNQGRIDITYNELTDAEVSRTTVQEATMGNHLYLTIDADLQRMVYEQLEQSVKEMLAKKINGKKSETGSSYTAIDVLIAMIDNETIRPRQLFNANSEYANHLRSLYEAYSRTKLDQLRGAVVNPKLLLRNYDEDLMTMYNTWIEIMRDAEGILSRDYQKTGVFYEQYKNGEKSAAEFLEYCFYSDFIDLEPYGLAHEMDVNVIFPAFIEAEFEKLQDNESFMRLMCEWLLRDKAFSDHDFLLILYDIGYLSNADGSRDRLMLNQATPEQTLAAKILDSEILPTDIHLDPYSASAVITSVETGEVLAIASYPSYDNNRFVSDEDYYLSVVTSSSSPMIFRALEEGRAPGSTFKLCTSITALEYHKIDDKEKIYDDYEFTKVHSNDNPVCHSTESHGSINIAEAIMVSCNYFFYTMGYRLCDPVEDDQGNFDYKDIVGLERMAAFAKDLGLATKTGIELNEAEPQTSVQDAVRSAIGQGTNSYTTANINRYTCTIANDGVVKDLFLVARVTDYAGRTIEETRPHVDHKANVSQSSFDLVKQGMRMMANDNLTLSNFMDDSGIIVAGKTGTAQELNNRPDHALFTGITNIDNPEVVITVTVPFGGNSYHAVDLFAELAKIYYDLDKDEAGSEEYAAN